MPYTPVSNLSRRGEKIAPFVSVQNALGMVALAAVGWIASAAFPGPVQFFLTILLAVVGYLITMDVRGMSLYERVLWQLRGRVRSLIRGRTIAPEDLPGTVIQTKLAVTRRGGPVRLRLDSPVASTRVKAVVASRTAAPRRLPRIVPAAPLAPVILAAGSGDGATSFIEIVAVDPAPPIEIVAVDPAPEPAGSDDDTVVTDLGLVNHAA